MPYIVKRPKKIMSINIDPELWKDLVLLSKKQERSISEIASQSLGATVDRELAMSKPMSESTAGVIAAACVAGLIVLVLFAGFFFDQPPVKSEVVTGVVDGYSRLGPQIWISIENQDGPDSNGEKGADGGTRGWLLFCDTPPPLIAGEKYTFTYRKNKLISCYKVQ